MLKGKKIMVLDDDPATRLIVRKVLESEDARVREAANVEQAMAYARNQPLDLILTDLNMPGKSGFDLLLMRMRTDWLRAIPTLVLSSHSDKAYVHRAILMGVDGYLLKPLDPRMLLQKVLKTLEHDGFACRKFPTLGKPVGKVTVDAELVRINEAGVVIQSTSKLAANDNIEVESDFLNKGLKCHGVLTRTTERSGRFLTTGKYLSEVCFVGVGEVFSGAMRAMIGRWK